MSPLTRDLSKKLEHSGSWTSTSNSMRRHAVHPRTLSPISLAIPARQALRAAPTPPIPQPTAPSCRWHPTTLEAKPMNEITPIQAAKPEIIRIVKLEPKPRGCDFVRPVISAARECRRLGFKLPLQVYLCGDWNDATEAPLWWGEFYLDDRRDGQGLVVVEHGERNPEVELPALAVITEAGDRGRFGYLAIGHRGRAQRCAALRAQRRRGRRGMTMTTSDNVVPICKALPAVLGRHSSRGSPSPARAHHRRRQRRGVPERDE